MQTRSTKNGRGKIFKLARAFCSIVSLLVLLETPEIHGQSSAFTYQGKLAEGGTAANGSYDLQFTLYDAAADGSVVSGPITRAPINVEGGLFVAVLDFGTEVLSGADRWLQIGVRTNGAAGPYDILSPRQRLTPVPYATRAALFNGGITDGQLSTNIARLNANQTFSGVVNLNNAANSITGNGAGLTNLLPSAMRPAELNQDGRMSSNLVWQLNPPGDIYFGPPPMVVNSWGLTGTLIDAAMVTNMVDKLLTNGAAQAGWNYVVLDEGWLSASGRDASGNLIGDPVKFPSGLRALSQWIHSKGLKFGLYHNLGTNSEASDYFGSQASSNTLGYLIQDAHILATNICVDYVKLNYAYNWTEPKDEERNAELQRIFIKAFLETGRTAFFWLLPPKRRYDHWYSSFGSDWRGPIFDGNIGSWFYTILNFDIMQPYYSSIRPGHLVSIESQVSTVSPQVLKSTMSLWAILSAQMIMESTPASKAEWLTNREVIAINQDVTTPYRLSSVTNNGYACDVWVKPLSSGGRAVALVNRQEVPFTFSVPVTNLGIGNLWTVRDPWEKTYVAYITNANFAPTIPGHSAYLYTISPGILPPFKGSTNYLSDLNWMNTTTNGPNGNPGLFGPIQRDNDAGGNPLTVGGVVYAKGLGPLPNAWLECFTGGAASLFHALFGAADTAISPLVQYTIYTNDILALDFTINAAGTFSNVNLSMAGVQKLSIGVLSSLTNVNFVRAAIADAYLVSPNAGRFQGSFAGSFAGDGAGLTNVPGAIPSLPVEGNSVEARPNTAYEATGAQQLQITLPSDVHIGDLVRVHGLGSGGWQIETAPGQTVNGQQAGLQWIARQTARNWKSVASSADGTKLAAVEGGGRIYTSSDAGTNWIACGSARDWTTIASSADGRFLVAGVLGGELHISSDGGVTWVARDAKRSWAAVACSADGTRAVAATEGGRLYSSVDGGKIWNARDVDRPWRSIACSANGADVIAGVFGGQIFKMPMSGSNGVPCELSRAWRSVASSADGTRLAAVENQPGTGGRIYISSDRGTTWLARGMNRTWASIASSADGARLIAAASGGQIYISTDGGNDWAARERERNWQSVASSVDGRRLVAAVGGGQIFTSGTIPLAGSQGSTVELRYAGNGIWQAANLPQSIENVPNTIVRRDANGAFSAGAITASSLALDTTNAPLKLTVSGVGPSDSPSAAAILLENTSPGGHAWEWHALDNGGMQLKDFTAGPTGTRLVIDSRGNVGVGTESPAVMLDVNGLATKPGGGLWSSASDRRLKKNIRPLAGALDKLLALHGVNFEYVDPAKLHELPGEQMGLVAQEVERVFPDWVETGLDGYKRVTVRGLEALVVEGLRELQERQNARLLELKQEKDDEIRQLKQAIADLKTKLEKRR